jgi:hypothetical protein
MPETSIKTGDVDFILPLNEIAPKLIEWLARQRIKNGRTTADRKANPQASPGKTCDAALFSRNQRCHD